jgi:hydrogenase-4 component B
MFAGVALIVFGGLGAALLSRHTQLGERVYRLLFGSGCVLAATPAINVLLGGEYHELRFEAGIPGGAWVFGVDALSAVFLIIVIVVGAASAFYGVTYFRLTMSQPRAAIANLFAALLVAALALVVTARAAMPFLIAWECMALSTYLLVIIEHEQAAMRRAGLLYLISTHTATLLLFILFAAWGSEATDLTFSSLAQARPSGGAASALLALALVAFGLKAGVVPLHFWLPEAHAAAPTPVSALMSGVVIKMGIYGLLRVIALIGSPATWFGWLLLGSGAVSGVLGVLWALGQHDLKRLLAFHSVENIGIILLGMGAGVLGYAYHRPEVALLGFAGAILHTVNHALFKSLLFLGAGAIQHSAHTREIDALGGLWQSMPRTATAFLIGSAAIVGLPPLNGLVSEWLVFRSLLQAGFASDALRVAVLAAATLGLIGALALACFAKVVGLIFLGVPRQQLQHDTREAPGALLRPQFALAALCILIGTLPWFVLRPVLRAAAAVAGQRPEALLTDTTFLNYTLVAVALALMLVVTWMLRLRLAPRVRPTSAPTWACGYPAVTARMQYTASSFAAPLLVAYEPVVGVHTSRSADRLTTHATEPVLDLILHPSWRWIRSLASRMRGLQQGRLSTYLLYVILTLVMLLLYLLVAGR